MISYKVFLTNDAKRDLAEISHYIAEFDSLNNANYVLEQLKKLIGNISIFPERGTILRELQALGIRDYRQVYFKSYRIVYRIIEFQVHVSLIADGRRDMTSLLSRRLLNVIPPEKALELN